MLRSCALVLVVAIAGCSKSSPPAPSAKDAGAAKPADPGRAEQAKLGAAIECLNRHSGRVFEVRDAYLASADDEKPALLGLYGLDPCQRDVKEAGALTPAVPELDAASAAYVAALVALVAAYEELSGYYQKGEHIDDKGKKAETLRPSVIAAFDAFAAAHRELDGQVRVLNRKRHEADLAAREKAEGRNLEVIIDTMMLEAETLVAMMSASAGADLAAVDAQIAAYGKLVDEVDAYANAHPDEAQKRGSITNLRNYSKTFLAAAKVVARKLADKAEPTDAERAAAFDQYNFLVDNYNHH